MDLQEQLDRAIGHGPPLPAPERRLEAGRTAVRRRRARVATGAVAVMVAVALSTAALILTRPSAHDVVGPATSASDTPRSSEPTDAATSGSPETMRVVIVDGVPELAGHPVRETIGPVVNGDERAFGLDTTLAGVRSFVLLVRSDNSWQVRRLVTAHRGQELPSWLRSHGWLPTGESP